MENKQYIYNLPNESNEKQKLETNTNSIIIVGANGSGKSKLGAWMGKNNNHTHIIASKRLTYISENYRYGLKRMFKNKMIMMIQYLFYLDNKLKNYVQEIKINHLKLVLIICLKFLIKLLKKN
ncbi:hypothetical protein ACE254_001764 [Campylobacter coli]|nr:hypothetical protein [Campylobacter coli]